MGKLRAAYGRRISNSISGSASFGAGTKVLVLSWGELQGSSGIALTGVNVVT
ncbi:MAG TPA: hypothetical protein VNZ03_00390 [Terriglobales bacterium]|nr:hypothetical protein [Terriglobales bacterium]